MRLGATLSHESLVQNLSKPEIFTLLKHAIFQVTLDLRVHKRILLLGLVEWAADRRNKAAEAFLAWLLPQLHLLDDVVRVLERIIQSPVPEKHEVEFRFGPDVPDLFVAILEHNFLMEVQFSFVFDLISTKLLLEIG